MSGGGGASSCRDDDEDLRAGGVKGAVKAKLRFSFTEVTTLLEAVKKNRRVILRKFNKGVSAEAKKQTWAEITNQINGLGENRREVRQIMKKWADLKCDGKRHVVALRGPNGCTVRKKGLGPVEWAVHKILKMSPGGDGDSDRESGDAGESSKLHVQGPAAANPSSSLDSKDPAYPGGGGGVSYEISPLSSPEKELSGDPFNSSSDLDLEDGERTVDCEDDSLPPPTSTSTSPDGVLPRMKPVHTYSRNSQNHTSSRSPSGPSSSPVFPSTSDFDASSSSAAPPPFSNGTASSLPPVSSSSSSKANDSQPAPPYPSAAPSSSVSSRGLPLARPPTSGPNLSDPLPAGASSRDQVAQMASQSLLQQRASRALLTSVSHSLEALAQSVQLLVESQQESVQESLLLQRETVDILRDFSNTALTMLRDKSNGSQSHFIPGRGSV
ncbi:uncharacterized protein zgc:113149 [Brachionichthys hirsutus]|uniref:uncharacterized protein zgc:113149 n=1 Tax=Brachionichthys hirsutus TaxID=412623 RepID=UPI0036047016